MPGTRVCGLGRGELRGRSGILRRGLPVSRAVAVPVVAGRDPQPRRSKQKKLCVSSGETAFSYASCVSLGVDNRISLHKLEVLCLVVELGGVARAAEHLFVAQPVVTAHLRMLQERVGVQLLYRDGRRLRLTEGGEHVYAWATDVLSRTRELAREVDGLADGRRGSIVVAASVSVGSYALPPILHSFRRAHPQAEITLTVSDPRRTAADTEAGECDFAVLAAEGPPASPQLSSELLGYEPIVLVAAPDALPCGDRIEVTELSTLPMVSLPRGQLRRTLIDTQLQRLGVFLEHVTVELGHPEAMKSAALDGMGAALLSRWSVERELRTGALREIEIVNAQLAVPGFLVWRRRKHLTPIQAELRDFVRDALSRQMQSGPTHEQGHRSHASGDNHRLVVAGTGEPIADGQGSRNELTQPAV